MERKECANGLQLIRIAALKLKGNFSTLFMGAFAMSTPLILMIALPCILALLFEASWLVSIGVVLFAVFVGPLQIGYIKFFNETLEAKQPRISVVYSQLRPTIFTLRTIYISLLLFLMYIIGGILWIVPAGFAVSFYSMTLFFLEKFEYPRLSQAMNECSRKMIGNRLAMFSYKLIFYFVYFVILMIGVLFLLLINTLLQESFIVSWIVAICSVILFTFMYTMVTVYFHSANQIFFEDVLSRDEKKRAKKVNVDRAVSAVKDEQTQESQSKEEPKEKKEEKVDEKKDLENESNKKEGKDS